MADPAIANRPPPPSKRIKGLKDLHKLYWDKLKKHKAYMLPIFRHARYPLISLQDRQSGLDVQIVLSNDTSLSRHIINGFMQEYPYLRQLYYVVKTTFAVRGLSDVFRGGFGSYSLFMMIVASIRHNPHPRNDAAGALVNFLKFWRDFDTTKHGVSIEPVLLFDKAAKPMTNTVMSKLQEGTVKPLPSYMLSLRDPADETNDLGRKGVAIKHVQATFGALVQRLEQDLQVNTRPTILGPLVGPSYMLDSARRIRLEAYGKRLMNKLQHSLAKKAKAIREAESTSPKQAEGAIKHAKQDDEENGHSTRAVRIEERQKQVGETIEQPQLEAARASVQEHGEVVASTVGMPLVEENTETQIKKHH